MRGVPYHPLLVGASRHGLVGGVGVALRAFALVDLGILIERAELPIEGAVGETVVAERVVDFD